MIKTAYRKLFKHLRVMLLGLVLATIGAFVFSTDPSPLLNIITIFMFVFPIVQFVRCVLGYVPKIEAFRKLLDSLSLDEREEVEDAFHSGNSLGDIYVTRNFIVLHHCFNFTTIALTIIKRANIDSVELFHNTLPRSYQYVQIKTNDSKNVYRIEYPLFAISEKQLVNFIAGNGNSGVNTKYKVPADPIPFIFGLLMACLIGMGFMAYPTQTMPELRNNDLYSLLVSGWTYLFMIPMALVTPIMYLRHKGNVENKFLWLLATCFGVLWAWFMWEMSTVF